nr:sugar phosphate isomerase/epimerase [Bacteroidales bacterium]
DSFEFPFMCECLKGAGIEGFDLTVRPGGKVEPDKVETDLPKLVADARKQNLALDMMVTGILSASDPFTERILKTASEQGVTHYRLGWADYDQKLGIPQTLEKFKPQLKQLAELNKKYKINGGYQNHAGPRIGGPVWDLSGLLKDIPADYLGVQYDVRHAMVEGYNTWILGMKLVAPHISTLAIKDFTWQNVNGKVQAVTVPLGEGIVPWDQFFKTVVELKLKCPLTLHVEYALLDKSEESLPLARKQDIITGKLKKDMDFLNSYLKKYNLV